MPVQELSNNNPQEMPWESNKEFHKFGLYFKVKPKQRPQKPRPTTVSLGFLITTKNTLQSSKLGNKHLLGSGNDVLLDTLNSKAESLK